MPKQNLTRFKSMNFRVTLEEYDMIKKVQALTGIKSTRAYLLKQAIDGRVIHIELDSVKELNRLLGIFGNNVNQIARRANETGNVYAADIEEVLKRQDEIWSRQKEILRRLGDIQDALDVKKHRKRRTSNFSPAGPITEPQAAAQ
jgi:hypothetical protein